MRRNDHLVDLLNQKRPIETEALSAVPQNPVMHEFDQTSPVEEIEEASGSFAKHAG